MSSYAPASFLNVYSEKQGSKNLAALLSSVPFLLLTALYFLCYGLLNLDTQGADTRDVFDDFRLMLPASAAMHWWGNASADQALAPEVASGATTSAPLKRLQMLSDGLGDPRSFFISGSRMAMYVPNTKNAHTSFSGTVAVQSSSGSVASWSLAAGWAVPSQLISVFVAIPSRNVSVSDVARSQRFSRVISRQSSSGVVDFAVADIDVPLVSFRAEALGNLLHAHALSDVWVEVSFASPSSMPALVRVHSKYHPHVLQSFPSKSPAAAASFVIDGLNTLSFTVNVVDINQPRPFVPNFSFSFQWVVAGAVLALAALLIFALYLYLRCWVVVNNARANTGSLPICFASMPEYRGW